MTRGEFLTFIDITFYKVINLSLFLFRALNHSIYIYFHILKIVFFRKFLTFFRLITMCLHEIATSFNLCMYNSLESLFPCSLTKYQNNSVKEESVCLNAAHWGVAELSGYVP